MTKSCTPFLRNLSTSDSSSRCSPLQSSFAPTPRSTPFDASFTCLGFLPSSRLHSYAATFRLGSQAFATFRPPVFATARRLSPHTSLQAYSIPQPRPGSLPVQGILSTRSHHFLIGRSCPRRWTSPRSPTFAGWPHDVVLDFEALIRARPRSTYLRYSQRHVPLPSSGPSPPGTDSLRSVAAYPRPPLTTSTACTFAFAIAPAARPQRISREEHDGYVSAPPACSSFRTVSPNPPCDLSSSPSARLPASWTLAQHAHARKLPIVFEPSKLTHLWFPADELLSTATRRTVSRAMSCVGDALRTQSPASRARHSTHPPHGCPQDRPCLRRTTRAVTRSICRASTNDSDSCPSDPAALPASSPPWLPKKMNPLGDKLTA